MRLVSYNIRKAVGLDWKRDPDRIVDVLIEIDSDIVVLQEIDKRLGTRAGVLPLDRLANELGYQLASLADRPRSHGWFGNAVFYRNTMGKATSTRIELPYLEPRGAVSAYFHTQHLEVIGVHLGLTPRMRNRQLAALGHHIGKTGNPAIIAGDFNEWRSSMDFSIGNAELIIPGPSFHVSQPIAALDRFLIYGGVTATNSWVHDSELASRASDHFPIVLEFELMGENV